VAAQYPGWLIVLIPGALAFGLGLAFWLFRRPAAPLAVRRERMLELAGELGLRYYGAVGMEALSSLPACEFFGKTPCEGLQNLMAEKREPPRVLLFDYGWVATPPRKRGASGDDEQSPLYMVALARLPDGVRVTPACVHRKDWFGGPAGIEGLYALHLPGDPAFSNSFLIVGEPRDAVAGMLDEPVRKAIAGWTGRRPHPVVEVTPDWVAAYVESEPGEKDVARRGASLCRYASGIAATFSPQVPAPRKEIFDG
jgi:hypothetical protein